MIVLYEKIIIKESKTKELYSICIIQMNRLPALKLIYSLHYIKPNEYIYDGKGIINLDDSLTTYYNIMIKNNVSRNHEALVSLSNYIVDIRKTKNINISGLNNISDYRNKWIYKNKSVLQNIDFDNVKIDNDRLNQSNRNLHFIDSFNCKYFMGIDKDDSINDEYYLDKFRYETKNINIDKPISIWYEILN